MPVLKLVIGTDFFLQKAARLYDFYDVCGFFVRVIFVYCVSLIRFTACMDVRYMITITQHHPVSRPALFCDALDRITDGVLVMDANQRIVYANATVVDVLACTPEALPGQDIWVVFSDLVGTVFQEQYESAVSRQRPVTFCAFNERFRMWMEVRIFPSWEGVTVCLTDITERKEAEAALRASDTAKDEFLAVLSHELQTPLTSMLGWSDIALEQDTLALYQRAMPIVHRNARRQQRLINELLDMSKLLHGRFVLEQEPAELGILLGEVTDRTTSQAADAGLALTVNPITTRMPIYADIARISYCIEHLLGNSIKFTEPGGRIIVCCQRMGKNAVLTIRDTGLGIAADALQTIFTPFRQVERDEAAGGLGLGLAVVQGIVALHNGTISAASQGVGTGSTFMVKLPLQDASA
jgi:PAS domain S-box-containing protein